MVKGIPSHSPLDTACHEGEPLTSGECATADLFHHAKPLVFLVSAHSTASIGFLRSISTQALHYVQDDLKGGRCHSDLPIDMLNV